MRFFLRHAAREITLLPAQNPGGEGANHLIDGTSGLSAKIFRPPVPLDLGNRLEAMIQAPLPVLRGQLAWPKDIVEDARGKVVGYLQDYFGGDYVEMASAITPVTRPAWADAKELRRFAYDAALIMAELHSQSVLFPDFHPGQLLVSRRGPTVLIDAASCQFNYQGILFGCQVAKPAYQPPHFVGVRNWADTIKDRDVYSDDWSLGVSLFQITQGCDPFAGKFVGSGVGLNPRERAASGVFPFSSNCRDYLPPTHAEPYRFVKPELRALFERCFVDGHKRENRALRPTAQEWADTLFHLSTLRDDPSKPPMTSRVPTTLKSQPILAAAKTKIRSLAKTAKPKLQSWGVTVFAACLLMAVVVLTSIDWTETAVGGSRAIDMASSAETEQWNFKKPANVDPTVVIDKLRTRSKSE
ncbi:MAG: hypothetical protein KDB27_11725 [Planctomycetales bacterium]|nr:hypothetical protein [Planctomycetales bacterium]